MSRRFRTKSANSPASGAQVLVNISNDGYFGHSAAREQHLEIARMRAVENRRWLLRATNDGITADIDPAGRIVERLPMYQETEARAGFDYTSGITFYTAARRLVRVGMFDRGCDWAVVAAAALPSTAGVHTSVNAAR